MHKNRGVRLLLADDDPDDFELFRDALTELSLSVDMHRCENGVELMEKLKAAQTAELPDLIFLDLNMPQKNGFECVGEIRKQQLLNDVSVVIFSTSFEPDVVDRLYTYGADRYLVKPNNFTTLKNAIGRILDLANEAKLRRPTLQDFVMNL